MCVCLSVRYQQLFLLGPVLARSLCRSTAVSQVSTDWQKSNRCPQETRFSAASGVKGNFGVSFGSALFDCTVGYPVGSAVGCAAGAEAIVGSSVMAYGILFLLG
jgi:hypothetical protein